MTGFRMPRIPDLPATARPATPAPEWESMSKTSTSKLLIGRGVFCRRPRGRRFLSRSRGRHRHQFRHFFGRNLYFGGVRGHTRLNATATATRHTEENTNGHGTQPTRHQSLHFRISGTRRKSISRSVGKTTAPSFRRISKSRSRSPHRRSECRSPHHEVKLTESLTNRTEPSVKQTLTPPG